MQVNAKSIFNLLLIVFFAVMLVMSFEYNRLARMIPLFLGIIGLVMVLFQGIYDAFPAAQQKLGFLKEGGLTSSEDLPNKKVQDSSEDQNKTEEEKGWKEIFRIVAWLTAFLVVLYFIGYLVAVPVFLFLFIWLEGKKAIVNSLYTSLGTVAFMYILFEIVLNSPF